MATKSAYGASAQDICELFADFIDGAADRPAIALSQRKVDSISRNAIEKSLESFGYSPQPCTFATTEGLDAQALLVLIEGLDPLHVIAIDGASAHLLSQAYRTNYPLDAPIRVFGRQSLAFADLPSLIATNKPKAWSLLKTLPTRQK